MTDLEDCPECGGEATLVGGKRRSCTDCEFYEVWDGRETSSDAVDEPEQRTLDGDPVGQATLSFGEFDS